MSALETGGPVESCENCDRQIGKLESPFLFKQRVVCKQCFKALTEDQSDDVASEIEMSGREADAQASLIATGPARSSWTPNSPKLGHLGRRKTRSSGIAILILTGLAIGLLVGAAIASAMHAESVAIAFAVLAGLMVTLIFVWIPYAIAQSKGRDDKAMAIGVLSFFGIVTGGLLWIVAVVWALALDKSKSM